MIGFGRCLQIAAQRGSVTDVLNANALNVSVLQRERKPPGFSVAENDRMIRPDLEHSRVSGQVSVATLSVRTGSLQFGRMKWQV